MPTFWSTFLHTRSSFQRQHRCGMEASQVPKDAAFLSGTRSTALPRRPGVHATARMPSGILSCARGRRGRRSPMSRMRSAASFAACPILASSDSAAKGGCGQGFFPAPWRSISGPRAHAFQRRRTAPCPPRLPRAPRIQAVGGHRAPAGGGRKAAERRLEEGARRRPRVHRNIPGASGPGVYAALIFLAILLA